MRPFGPVLLALALAGCVTSSLPVAPVAAPGLAGWHLDCYHAANWSDPCTTRSTQSNGPANENWLAVNPKDPDNVVTAGKDYNDAASDCVWSGEESTHDGGQAWDNLIVGGSKAERMADPTNPLFGFQCVTDPMFTFDAEGTLYYVIEAYGRAPHDRQGLVPVLPSDDQTGLVRTLQHPDTGGNTMFIAVSHDGGKTLGAPVRVWDGEGTLLALDDKTFILANPKSGSVHFATSQFEEATGDSQMLVFTSRDHGASWSGPVIASDPDAHTTKFPASLAADRNGTLFLSWLDWSSNQITFTTSTDDGASFAPPRPIQAVKPVFQSPPHATFRVVSQPYMAIDRSGGARDGTLYMAWEENVSGHFDVRWMRSSDRGQTWSTPQLLSDAGDAHQRFHPALAVDAWGGVHITYLDQRYDPADKLLDLSWAISEDGATFRSFRVTNSSFDGDKGFHQDGFPFIGDYNGLGCSGAVCYASFPDTRDGRSEIAVARLVRG